MACRLVVSTKVSEEFFHLFHTVTLQQFNNITKSLTTDLLTTPQHGLIKDHKTFHKPAAFILHSEAGDNVPPEH
jgi:hypothetical protein